jgi:hypothetical protein
MIDTPPSIQQNYQCHIIIYGCSLFLFSAPLIPNFHAKKVSTILVLETVTYNYQCQVV